MSKRPEKKEILDLNANISDVNAYVRHKERVTGYNQACDEWEAYHNYTLEKLKCHKFPNDPNEVSKDFFHRRIDKAISKQLRG